MRILTCVLNVLASAKVVDLMKNLTHQAYEGAKVKNGLGTTLRTGPGHAGWAIEDQARLFSCFDGLSAPLRLNAANGCLQRREQG